jgi:hypothetical protein
MFKKRYLGKEIKQDLKRKMVFVAGPRQVGKTTMVENVGKSEYKKHQYLNWDFRNHRDLILEQKFNTETELVIFDELHKYDKWKNYLKGMYDVHKNRFGILVTGSARLDLYRKSGDSLLGRYHLLRLHPFSLAEILNIKNVIKPKKELSFPSEKKGGRKEFENLFKFGGFPEPFMAKDNRTLRRWHNERIDRLVKEDIRDSEVIRDLSALQILTDLLPEKVGSKLSLNSLRTDLNVAHKTVTSWVEILERFYYHFRIYPYTSNAIRSLRKEAKLYLWDWSELESKSIRLENMVASHLLKFVHYLKDVCGYKTDLFYLGDVDGREVDFLVTIDRKPWFSVEVKMTDNHQSKHIKYFGKRIGIPFSYQVVNVPKLDVLQGGTRIMSVDKFLTGLV